MILDIVDNIDNLLWGVHRHTGVSLVHVQCVLSMGSCSIAHTVTVVALEEIVLDLLA